MAAIGRIRSNSWLLIGIMVIALLAFLLMDIGGNGNQNYKQSDDLAMIDGEAISNQVFNDKVTANAANYRNQNKQQVLSDADMNGIKTATYSQMVSEKIFDKIFEETGITVGNAEFLDMLSGKHIHPSVAGSFKGEDGKYDVNLFTNFINSLDLENNPQDEPGTKRKSWKNFESGIIKERHAKKYNNLVEKSMTVPTFMAKDEFFNAQTQVSFSFVKVPFSSIVDSSLNLTDNDLNNYVKKHSKEFQQEESVDLKFASFPIIASENDKIEASKWINKKIGEWKDTKNDSAFITLYSDIAYDVAYYGKEELNNIYKDSLFNAPVGTIFGADKIGNQYTASKLMDRKFIPDSLKARHLLISLDGIKTQEEAFVKYNLFDSLYNLIDSSGYKLSDLTAQFSNDQSNASKGGDLEWVKPNTMVKPFNDEIFFGMKEGDVRKVTTRFGLHIVEVYKSKPTKLAVKVATLAKEILASGKTQERIYADASIFAGNNNSKEKFVAAEENTIINNAYGIFTDASTVQKIQGNSRQLIKWAFGAKEGDVSSPFSIGETYYVALVANKNPKGLVKVNDNNRLSIEIAAAKDKKADLIKAKMQGSDLNAIATANNVTVGTAQNASFSNLNVGGSLEGGVVGAAFGLNENTVSKAITGVDGVYVINVTSKALPAEDEASITNMKNTLKVQNKTTVSSRLTDALKKSVEIIDNRFDFF